MRFWQEFKNFAFHGNALDLAIGIIIGAAFNSVVKSLVGDILMPPIGLLIGRVNFNAMYINLSSKHYASLTAAKAAGAPVIAYGLFVNSLINFLLVAFAVFLVVQQINRLRRPAPVKKDETRLCPYCLSSVPQAATRCAQCTSEITPVAS